MLERTDDEFRNNQADADHLMRAATSVCPNRLPSPTAIRSRRAPAG
jgi:hypothetical protein